MALTLIQEFIAPFDSMPQRLLPFRQIASATSKNPCKETAHPLEVALTAYSRHFLRVEMPDRKARVLVFGSRQSYLGYAEDLRRDLTFSAGALPSLVTLKTYLFHSSAWRPSLGSSTDT